MSLILPYGWSGGGGYKYSTLTPCSAVPLSHSGSEDAQLNLTGCGQLENQCRHCLCEGQASLTVHDEDFLNGSDVCSSAKVKAKVVLHGSLHDVLVEEKDVLVVVFCAVTGVFIIVYVEDCERFPLFQFHNKALLFV